MSVFDPLELRFAEALSDLSHANPFSPERIDAERRALGEAFIDDGLWHRRAGDSPARPNIERLIERSSAVVEAVRERRLAGARPTEKEVGLYEDLVGYTLFYRASDDMRRTIEGDQEESTAPRRGEARFACYGPFRDDFARLLDFPEHRGPAGPDAAHVFATCYQLRRAFHHIFVGFIGASAPAVRLRAAVWESIFTHDSRRYRRTLFSRMGDMTTLITGPSGSGKELVARSIGLSRYLPFDAGARRFQVDVPGSYLALNLSALSPTLIESELFGHCRGAFTGAVSDRIGWLEQCPAHGTVFLDEIGELDESIQVKLLRVLENRTFQRLGETEPRHFHGKIIAATNRDIDRAMRDGRFREDLYYRLCSDMIETPGLHERIVDRPEEIADLVAFIAERFVGTAEGPALSAETLRWIDRELGDGYAWPGNVRELEQCVRNVLVRGSYRPPRSRELDALESLEAKIRAGVLTAEELLGSYCTLVYSHAGTYEETGRRLGLDRRTVKAKIDSALLDQLQGRHGPDRRVD